jgi:hypothetical protein
MRSLLCVLLVLWAAACSDSNGLPAATLTNVERAAYWVAAELARSGATRLSARRDASSVRLELEVPAKPPRLVDVEDRVGALDGSTIVRDIGSHVCVQVEIPCG